MPAYFKATLKEFVSLSTDEVVGALARANANAPTQFKLAPESIQAWERQLGPLQSGISEFLLQHPSAAEAAILLEYPIPMVGRRIDAVILISNVVLVIETKTGFAPSSAVRQVEDYALNLACFHECCSQKYIVPLVISNARSGRSGQTAFDDLMEETMITAPENLGVNLRQIADRYLRNQSFLTDIDAFDSGRFKPIPRIIDAAVSLYQDKDVFEIGHACAAEESLARTTATLIDAVRDAETSTKKTICFVTGVPGAGKTLVGLNTIHDPAIKDLGSFLSGNGPLVKVVQEALIRDIVERSSKTANRVTRADAGLRVRAFIHNVHRFVDEHMNTCPAKRVVVFDEAQRAWDKAQNEKAGRAGSEPETILRIMDQHEDWAVIIALVGGGQEINRGEAGLAEWGRALQNFLKWQIFASPEVLAGGSAVAGFRLFDPECAANIDMRRIQQNDNLHLNVATRSIRAKQISQWVNAVLEGKEMEARDSASAMEAKPLLCRNLSDLRTWLHRARRGSTRSGLVVSSSASRMRADGVETAFDFHQRFEWEHWFLDSWECPKPDCRHQYCNDVRSSSTLEVAGTQFEVQGLELDWVGVCWGEDFTWAGSQWEVRKFNNRKWIPQKDAQKAHYVKNAYRVLMTRARQQMAIYIPRVESNDATRLGESLEVTAKWLLSCGALELHPIGSDNQLSSS
jgi:hypothetical protein